MSGKLDTGQSSYFLVAGYGQGASNLSWGWSRVTRIEDNTFVARSGRQVACKGDSGGPALEAGPGAQFAVASRHDSSENCGDPFVYVRIDVEDVHKWVVEEAGKCSSE
ncbi:MAG: trypsin-like serine protease [Vicinamibacterales bacterium]|nr:trypsin-like serine protease [Vicinamibacterales bacterium]